MEMEEPPRLSEELSRRYSEPPEPEPEPEKVIIDVNNKEVISKINAQIKAHLMNLTETGKIIISNYNKMQNDYTFSSPSKGSFNFQPRRPDVPPLTPAVFNKQLMIAFDMELKRVQSSIIGTGNVPDGYTSVSFGKRRRNTRRKTSKNTRKTTRKVKSRSTRKHSFGKRRKTTVPGLRRKYTRAGGRKSPSSSATKYPVGHIGIGLDGNHWIIKKASNGVKRWVKM
jgi:hypothetical protein